MAGKLFRNVIMLMLITTIIFGASSCIFNTKIGVDEVWDTYSEPFKAKVISEYGERAEVTEIRAETQAIGGWFWGITFGPTGRLKGNIKINCWYKSFEVFYDTENDEIILPENFKPEYNVPFIAFFTVSFITVTVILILLIRKVLVKTMAFIRSR